jgi:hypothetical protein
MRMRDLLEEWGRKRWPDARVIHELKIEPCRCDIAFVLPNDLILVEIKSSKDSLDRLPKQMEVFRQHATRVYLAIAKKWEDHKDIKWGYNAMVVDAESGCVEKSIFQLEKKIWRSYTTMLDLLWAEEARQIAIRHRLDVTKRSPLSYTTSLLAGMLTGNQIVAEVCRELRSRPTNHKADKPIYLEGATP